MQNTRDIFLNLYLRVVLLYALMCTLLGWSIPTDLRGSGLHLPHVRRLLEWNIGICGLGTCATFSYSSKLFILLLYLRVYARLTAWRCKTPARRTFSRPLVYYESTARVTSHISSSFIKLVAARASRRRGSGRHWQAYTSAPSFARRFLAARTIHSSW